MMAPLSSMRSDNNANAKRRRSASRGAAIEGGCVMRRSSLEMLPRSDRRQLQALRILNFESVSDAIEEDCKRSASLRSKLVRDCANIDQAKAADLADRLDPEINFPPRSPSSSRFMRRVRAQVTYGLDSVDFH